MNNTEQIYREYKLGVKDMARAVKEFQKLVNKCDGSFDNTEVYLSDMEMAVDDLMKDEALPDDLLRPMQRIFDSVERAYLGTQEAKSHFEDAVEGMKKLTL
ncbi:MAG: hypothetical protein Unbinned1529contig1001_27 [Prokaryotic dsDNA virus sp.]|nr:MAG: hypothetical protein Unbinned1529contig1001_27 [Prokaryotic dsDNA virus sp.]|tara:strand:+ start:854 stop:1156 length:303 start_codon:yes stop_codon:yes gene_type:complete